MARKGRTRSISGTQVRSYVAKAEEYLSAAEHELEAGRAIAATSLAIHAGINAADAVCGTRLGRRAGGQDHDEALALLRTAGPDGVAVAKDLVRLLPMKTRAEYEPDEIPKSDAKKAVDRARRVVAVARRVAASVDPT